MLACTLLLTFGAWRYAERTVRANEQERFDRVVAMSRAAIDRRLESYLQILMGVRALFASSDEVERAEFRSYVAAWPSRTAIRASGASAGSPRVPAALRARTRRRSARQGRALRL